MAEVMGYPLGVCPQHGPKLAVNGTPTCIKCKAKEDNANRTLVVSTVEDPGEAYFNKGGAGAPAAAKSVESKAKALPEHSMTMSEGLNEILGILSRIPMPSSMKQYKLLMNVKQKIESALQEEQNG